MSGVWNWAMPWVSDEQPSRGKGISLENGKWINPDKSPLLLTTEELGKVILDFNWEEGHSGMIMDDDAAMRLDELWQDYVESVHMAAEEHEVDEHAMQYYKESGWEMVGKETKKNTFYLAATPF